MPCEPLVVHLVGAGPGDPDLLTVKAARLLAARRRPGPRPPGRRGRARAWHPLARGESTSARPPAGQALTPGARSTSSWSSSPSRVGVVVRLKGGDPFVFGRGGEEALHLLRHGMPFEVVPGVTAALGCAAAAMIPLTHRGVATSVRSRHRPLPRGLVARPRLAEPRRSARPRSCSTWARRISPRSPGRLIEAGLSRLTPAAAIAEGHSRRSVWCGRRSAVARAPRSGRPAWRRRCCS